MAMKLKQRSARSSNARHDLQHKPYFNVKVGTRKFFPLLKNKAMKRFLFADEVAKRVAKLRECRVRLDDRRRVVVVVVVVGFGHKEETAATDGQIG